MAKEARLVLVALLGLVWWFCGNAYEAIVISPNWVHDSAAQLARMNALYQHTSPATYFVPLTQLATLLVWYASLRNRQPSAAPYLRRASLLALPLTALNVFIVSSIIVRLFGSARALDPLVVHELVVRWNALNLLRLALTGATLVALFQAFRRLDRLTPL